MASDLQSRLGSVEGMEVSRMEVINKYCPRSGKPVVEDSLAEYRGFTVGFCNPGCRDDFRANVNERPDDTRYFDSIIRENDLRQDH
jgi:hypothetical protein